MFFDHVGDAARRRGHDAFRVVFCLGDHLYWRRKSRVWFRGHLEDWPDFFRKCLLKHEATDVVMLGDSRVRHKIAIDVARELGVGTHIVEHGYFRPDWLTHETVGMGTRSSFRADWSERRPAENTFASFDLSCVETKVFKNSFLEYAALDVAYNLANVFSRLVVAPNYAGHSNISPFLEYAGWLHKIMFCRGRGATADRVFHDVSTRTERYYLWALQLETDYQIRDCGLGTGQVDLISPVVKSFSTYAPPGSTLFVKDHPLDNTLLNWSQRLKTACRALGVPEERVVFLGGGDLNSIMARADGVFSVNSSVGFRSIAVGRKTLSLAPALYDLPGLTVQGGIGGLDQFWRSDERPDPALAQRFLAGLLYETQFRGAFDGEGVGEAAESLIRRLERTPPSRPAARSAPTA